jgi:GNAT superfamily N-acetyltransferase
VATETAEIVGTAHAHIEVASSVSEEPAVELSGVFVRPDHRGRGIARALTVEAARSGTNEAFAGSWSRCSGRTKRR